MQLAPGTADGHGLTEAVTIGVSVSVPEPFGSAIQDTRAAHGDPLARAIPTHITLLPPTGIPAGALPEVRSHLAAVARAYRSFHVLLQGAGSFRPVSPVVYLRVEAGAQECRELEAAIRSGPLARELAFPYHPHVTVAHGLPEPVLDAAYAEARTFQASFAVPGFSLSRFGADEVWRPWQSFDFGA